MRRLWRQAANSLRPALDVLEGVRVTGERRGKQHEGVLSVRLQHEVHLDPLAGKSRLHAAQSLFDRHAYAGLIENRAEKDEQRLQSEAAEGLDPRSHVIAPACHAVPSD